MINFIFNNWFLILCFNIFLFALYIYYEFEMGGKND